MSEIIITPVPSYFADGVELWDMRRIAVEYGISKATLRVMLETTDFPRPFAHTAVKLFFVAKDVQHWAENTDHLKKTLARRARGIGRPTTNRKEAGIIKATKS